MTPQELIAAARLQQELTGNSAASVALKMSGKCPPSGKRRLFGRAGPWGHVVNETDSGVVCLFKADEVIAVVEWSLAKESTDA